MNKKQVIIKLVVAVVVLGIAAGVAAFIYMLFPSPATPLEPELSTSLEPTEQPDGKWTSGEEESSTGWNSTGDQADAEWKPTDQLNQQIRNNLESFAFYLYRMMSKNGADGNNIVFSPLSIYSALSFIGQGAESVTLEQIGNALYTTNLSNIQSFISTTFRENEKYNLSLVQRIFIDNSINIREPFEDFLNESGLPAVKRMDFHGDPQSCRKYINEWVENKTLNQIKELLSEDQVTADTLIHVVNALALEASWHTSRLAREAAFAISQNEEIQTQMIFIEDLSQNATPPYKPCEWSKTNTTTVVVLPLEGGILEYVVVMPNKTGDFSEIHTRTGQRNLLNVITHPLSAGCDVFMPKFKLNYKYNNLKENLKEMGIRDMFDAKADFSRLYEGPRSLYVEDVVHSATFDLDEKGVKASATTGFGGAYFSLSEIPRIIINKPFLFLVRNKLNGALLLMGKVVNPLHS